ncbi:GNAT family N-acetyltransferase [Cellulomonas telluris]|uniref:GNAT family N-acetyltransferase n=1 Tax=Cellulomonas telluris TaxID=2306636 RepID=UPI0010A87FE4|nr:GNAT family N-acetyltransferase [Cellulomonas telluris]
MSVQVDVRDVAEVDGAAGWSVLARDHLYSDLPWLRATATDPTGTVGCALARDTAPLAALPFAQVTREGNAFYRWPDLLAARGLHAAGQRLQLGPRRGYRTAVLTAPDADGARLDDAVAALVTTLARTAHDAGLDGLVAPYADTATAVRLRTVVPDALVVHVATDAWVPLVGTGVEDHLERLGGHRRRRLRPEVAAAERLAADVERRPLADVVDEVAPLLARTQERYGHPAPVGPLTASLRAQAAATGDRAEALVLRRDGRAVGFVSFYAQGDTLYLRALGVDHEATAGEPAYFALAFHWPVRLAYERGLRAVHLGIESAEAKVLRGARLRPLWLVDLVPASARQRSAAVRHGERVLSELEASRVLGHAVDRADWVPALG